MKDDESDDSSSNDDSSSSKSNSKSSKEEDCDDEVEDCDDDDDSDMDNDSDEDCDDEVEDCDDDSDMDDDSPKKKVTTTESARQNYKALDHEGELVVNILDVSGDVTEDAFLKRYDDWLKKHCTDDYDNICDILGDVPFLGHKTEDRPDKSMKFNDWMLDQLKWARENT